MTNRYFRLASNACAQSVTEYVLIFAAIVLLTLFASNVLLARMRAVAETNRNDAMARILGSGGGGGE